MSGAPRVWITRAQPGADRTAERLRALGLAPVVRPLLAVQPLSPDLPDLADFAALAFTSINGVGAFARLHAGRDLPVFAVGDATAQAARQAGFADVRSASGDLTDLARLLADRAPGSVLAPVAETPAGDLAEAVQAAGGAQLVRAIAVYRTVETGAALPDAVAAVLIHSPRAARALAACAPFAMPRLAVCISPAAAAPLQALARPCAVSPTPDETALLTTLSAALGKRGPPV